MSKSTITLPTIFNCHPGEYIWVGTKMYRVLNQVSGYTLEIEPARWWTRLWYWMRGRWAMISSRVFR